MHTFVAITADAARSPDRVPVVMDLDGTITAGDCLVVVLGRHVAAWPRLAEAIRDDRLAEVQASGGLSGWCVFHT
jgi:hypothetical protein